MSRPLRIEFNGGLYHITSRGDRSEDIYADDVDRSAWLQVLDEVCRRFNWVVHAYCLMSNHYHLLLQTPEGNLSAGMRQLNGVYTQRVNRRHGRAGHVFQGRYKAILVDSDAHLLELARYIVLNPVRAGMVKSASDWRWSSYAVMVGSQAAPPWMAVDAMLAQFAVRRPVAVRRYVDHVRAGIGQPSIWAHLNGQVYLGDDAFVSRMQRKAGRGLSDLLEVPRAQRRAPAKPLAHYTGLKVSRERAMARAYASGDFTMAEVAQAFDVHYSTVSRAVNQTNQAMLPVRSRLEPAPSRKRQPTEPGGFTLLELLVVMVIIGLLASYVAPRYFDQIGKSEVKTTRAQLDAFENALGAYRLDTGHYPSTEQGLRTLVERPSDEPKWSGPYLSRALPVDPWGRHYAYRYPGDSGHDFELTSLGKDGQPGGSGLDADVSVWTSGR